MAVAVTRFNRSDRTLSMAPKSFMKAMPHAPPIFPLKASPPARRHDSEVHIHEKWKQGKRLLKDKSLKLSIPGITG
ncbi:hypothetical protein LOK49_LG11G00980 [Camellia lanceoleosa]|uniref:Uncharacterized protein n=1 Tax=Camellia lanceoleosa TaxID=1840588 RepID=A0ACC0FZX1_9ERIC|nr:hypothetical protein LOK49_LG11G00980 [Camellia lanceoleosa]